MASRAALLLVGRHMKNRTVDSAGRATCCRLPGSSLFAGFLVLVSVVDGWSEEAWKYDVEVISSPRYVVNNYQTWCDDRDRIWVSAGLSFGENTDAYHSRHVMVVLVSTDLGVTWNVSKKSWPGPRDDLSVMPDGMLVETGTHHWLRHPRSQAATLQKRGYYVWDLGEKAGYCAILGSMWVRRSIDRGRTWSEFSVHRQFGFFARLAVNSPPRQRLLADGTIVNFMHGYRPEGRNTSSDLGGLNHPFVVRSEDAGRTWRMIRMADGKLSPSTRGFNEVYPVVWPDGRIFAMIRTAAGGRAFSVSSIDGGLTWSKVKASPIRAKHPNPTILADGSVVCSYQRRFAVPFGVRARFTSNLGKTWGPEVMLRDDVPIADGLVQPQTVELSDGTLFTLFTGTKVLKTGGRRSFIGASRWARDRKPLPGVDEKREVIRRRGSWSPAFPLPPLTPRYNFRTAGQSPWSKPVSGKVE